MKNWRLAPPRANYWAQDEYGPAKWFEDDPWPETNDGGLGSWETDEWCENDGTSDYSTANTNWRDSKERRPQPIIGMRWVERRLSRHQMHHGEIIHSEIIGNAKILQQQTEGGEWSDVPTITE